MRALLLAVLLLQHVGVGIPITSPELNGPAVQPVECTVNPLPSPICPGDITVDVAFSVVGSSLRGGDHLGLGEAGCPSVRHEFILTANGSAIGTGVTLAAWEQEVLTSAATDVSSLTLTTAQWTGLGSPVVVDLWLRSWTPNDFASQTDFCTTVVL